MAISKSAAFCLKIKYQR